MSALSTGASALDLVIVLTCAGGIVGLGLAVSRRAARAGASLLILTAAVVVLFR